MKEKIAFHNDNIFQVWKLISEKTWLGKANIVEDLDGQSPVYEVNKLSGFSDNNQVVFLWEKISCF